MFFDPGPHPLDAANVSLHAVSHVTYVRPDLLEAQECIERHFASDTTLLDRSLGQETPEKQDRESARRVRLRCEVRDDVPPECCPDGLSAEGVS